MVLPVKWFSNAMAPTMLLSTGSAGAAHTVTQGSLISLLKACLVTGFGIKTVSSVNYDAANAKIVVTISSGHTYQLYQVIELSGANESGFNGQFRVMNVTTTTVECALDNGIPAAASATGSLSAKIPGLGWGVAYEDAVNNKVIFKRLDPSNDYMLLVDNSAWSGWNNSTGHLAKVKVVTGVTDINTFTVVSDQRWPCSHNYASPDWLLIGDSRFFVFLPRFAAAGSREMDCFGDIPSLRAGDKHATLFQYHCSSPTESIYWADPLAWPYNNAGLINEGSYRQIMRSYHQLPGVVPARIVGDHPGGIFGGGLPNAGIPVNPADAGFYSAKNLKIFDDQCWRGTMPGLVAPYSSPVNFDKSVVQGINGELTLYAMVARKMSSGSNQASILLGFDIKGPWR